MADLVVRDLEVTLGGRTILRQCSGEFPAGRRTVLWGPSGAGKSTLLAAIAGLVKPVAGSIRFGERVLWSQDGDIDLYPHQRHIGLVFQDLALWPHLDATEQVYAVGRSAGLTRAGAISLLQSVELEGLERRRPGQLSGGEQQRLAIARAVAARPSILLLDEPFSSVDANTKSLLHMLLRKLSPQVAGPTIYVTHNAEDARALGEVVLSIEGGQLVAGGRY